MSNGAVNPANIKAITFDLWETLLLDELGFGKKRAQLRIVGVSQILHRSGYSFSDTDLWKAYVSCSNICNEIRIEGRDISFLEQVGKFLEQIEPDLPNHLSQGIMDNIAMAYDKPFMDFPPLFHACTHSILSELKSKGYLLGLISNTAMTPGSTFRSYMSEVGILKYFDVLIFSNEVGFAKPSKDIFQSALKVLRVDPTRVIHVGDDLKRDVEGAKLAGFRTIWITRSHDSYDVLDSIVPSDESMADIRVGDLSEVICAVQHLDSR